MLKSSFTILILSFFFMLAQYVFGQGIPNTKEAYDSLYNINIRLVKINGVYIPRDLDDAHRRIEKLSPSGSIERFIGEEEELVCKKLHFGIGRWMILNWNFYEGSRISHYLKEKGLLHPDDMAQFLLRTLHRKLNNHSLNEEELILELANLRLKEIEEIYKN